MTRPESPGAARPARTTASAAFAAEGFTTEEAARIHAEIAAYNRKESRGFIAELRAMGFRLLPLPGNKKKPPPTGYPTNGVDYLIRDGANVGIDTEHFGNGGALLVVDVDNKGDKRGEQSLTRLEETHGKLPPTLTTVTPTGGRHLFFRVPRPVAPSVSKIGEALDVRSRGGYVVAPGSKVPAGVYRFAGQENAPAGSVVSAGTYPPIAEAPAWLVELCGEPRERTADAVVPLPGVDPARARERATEYLRAAGPAIEGAGGDATTFATAARVKDFGVSEPECIELMLEHWNERCEPPWRADELARKCANAYRYGNERPGSAAPEAVFEAVEHARAKTASTESLRLVDISNIEAASIDAPRFVVDKIVPAGLVTLLGGHGGAGKSILALVIAAHVAAGVPWHGLAVEAAPALFVSLEDSGKLTRFRLRKVIQACGLDAQAVTSALKIVDGENAGPLMHESGRWAAKLEETPVLGQLRDLIGTARLIVIDNASDAFDGNENQRQQVRAFVRTLGQLGRANNAAVILLAHVDKNAARYGAQDNTYSGSTAWHNTARSRLAMIEDKRNTGLIELRHEKSNHGKRAASLWLRWTDDGVPLPVNERQADTAEDDAAAVLKAIEAAMRDGENVPTSRTGPATAQHVLERFPELPQRMRGAAGRPAFWAAITALHRSERIKIEGYRNGQRKQCTRFVPGALVCAGSAPVWN